MSVLLPTLASMGGPVWILLVAFAVIALLFIRVMPDRCEDFDDFPCGGGNGQIELCP